jgi:hypothetical protein
MSLIKTFYPPNPAWNVIELKPNSASGVIYCQVPVAGHPCSCPVANSPTAIEGHRERVHPTRPTDRG